MKRNTPQATRMASTKPLSRKRLNLGDDDEDDEDSDGQDTAASVTNTGLASSKLQKTAKKRVNPFKTASVNAKPKISSLPPPPTPLSAPKSKSSASTQFPEPTSTTNTTNANTTNTSNTNETEEEDDYLSMSLTTLPPTSTSLETYTQRRLRLARESEARARVPSKAELAQQEKQRREEGLARSLLEDKSSKGYRMMKAMGWKGEGLGKAAHHQPQKQPVAQGGEEEDGDIDGDSSPEGGVRLGLGYPGGTAASDITPQQHQQPHGPILEPIALSIKEDRAGIGHLTSEKHKFRKSLHRSGISPTAQPTPPPHELAESYRTRLRLDKQEKRAEAQFYSAQTILEGFDRGESQTSPPNQLPQSQRELSPLGSRHPPNANKGTTAPLRTVPLKSIPLLYRSLILHRESKDRQKRARYEFMESLSSTKHSTSKPLNLPGYERDFEDKIVYGATQTIEDDGDLEEDEELEEFNQLPFTERLGMIVGELRERWKYCFWCKYQYASQEEVDESCPGLGEDVHG